MHNCNKHIIFVENKIFVTTKIKIDLIYTFSDQFLPDVTLNFKNNKNQVFLQTRICKNVF